MPYLDPERRFEIRESFKNVISPVTPGEVNYMIQLIAMGYIGQKNILNYEILNDVIGAMESAKLEFYHRVVRPYEDKKIKKNGDIYNDEYYDEKIKQSRDDISS